ncbi:MAG TPA: SGNH/GDSL hydrolase family protein [Phenylobacterium sp.]|nr:SGNH/GDSL hydrolase family protein [Phenylobacterium sp.]
MGSPLEMIRSQSFPAWAARNQTFPLVREPDLQQAGVDPRLPRFLSVARAPSRSTVACLGSSSTAGRGQAFDWIGALARRPGNAHLDFRNFGVGGDLAYNALQRLPQVSACRPDKVVVWVGGNDVLAMVFPKLRRVLRLFKHLPREPSPDWFRENLTALAQGLKSHAAGEIALCSLAPIGEAPNSSDPTQHTLNRLVGECSAIVADIAGAEGCRYLPVYEALQAEFLRAPGQAFATFDFLPFYRDAVRTVLLGQSPDDVALRNGWRLHSDGVHLNSRGGMIAADLVQGFIDGVDSA